MDSELSPQSEQYLTEIVADGIFPSKAAALEAAVAALREKHEPVPLIPAEHMALVEEAIESANAGECREMADDDWEALRQIIRDVEAKKSTTK